MNLKTWYDSGSATVLSGSTTVTGTGALWGTGTPDDNIMVGDLFSVPSQPMVPAIPIASVSADGELELLWPWPGTDVMAQPYIIRYVGIIERSTRANRMALERMGEISAWYDVIVADDAARLTLETESSPLRANYRVLVRQDGVIWAKRTSAYGDWEGPVEFRGPSITLDVTEVDEVPYGTPPEVNMTPRAGGYDLAFDIPRGMIIEPGTTTTLAADQPAAVTFVPVTGGYRLDIAIPRGPTGDIDGVTPFWVSRLGSDADAAAARAGLGAIAKPASATNLRIAVFADDGKSLEDSGKTLAEVVPANNSITNDILADMATATIKGRAAAGAGDPEDLTAAQALAILKTAGAYARDNILGIVSQLGGLATGAIIERGSNANGSYVRFADGTQICLNRRSETKAVNLTSGAIFYGAASPVHTYPAAFVSLPDYADVSLSAGSAAVWKAANGDHSALAWAPWYPFSDASRSSVTLISLYLAIGRWF